MLKSYLIGVLSAFLAAVGCLFLFAFICVGGDDPRAFASLFGIAAYLFGGVCGALLATALHRDGARTVSLAVSCTYAFVVFLASTLYRSEASRPLWQSLLICLAVPAVSFIAGTLISARMGSAGVTRKKLHKRIMKR
ncbi:MAG: hypothetical protein IJ519_03525 [Clostridia bacterium]|nr:hypothetical protein [Clostridia bacterium]